MKKKKLLPKYLNSFGFANLKPFWTISTNNISVLFLLPLKDGRIGTVINHQIIKIYNILTKKCDITIQRESNSDCKCLSENRLAVCSVYEEVKIRTLASPYGESSKQPVKIFSGNYDIRTMNYFRQKEIKFSFFPFYYS